ncbi:MAG: phosphotransferase [Rhodothermaceae bacterium]|nr:MAG: phosphotransferase [Rhodothermaceae bacterium]
MTLTEQTKAPPFSPHEIRRLAGACVPGFEPAGMPESLGGGLLNHVWRVPGRPAPVIAKHAPPHLASAPAVPLDPSRLRFEAHALTTLSPEGHLAGLVSEAVRPPRPLGFVPERALLFMEDAGSRPDLHAWLYAATPAATIREAGTRLGAFIARLHARTLGDPMLARTFDNRAIQTTRRAVQYAAVADLLRRLGPPGAAHLAERALALGDALLQPGRCLIMGDLWPRSILPGRDGTLRLIDWEFAHFGRPLQDVAHLDAHLWMLAHRAPNASARRRVNTFRKAFLTAYHRTLEADAPALFDDEERDLYAVHFACELLVRAAGPFQAGYLYDGLSPTDPVVREVFLAITA